MLEENLNFGLQKEFHQEVPKWTFQTVQTQSYSLKEISICHLKTAFKILF